MLCLGIEMPQVSVIMPSYNHAAFVSAAIKSVLAQSISDWELIIIDDGSTDESLSILSRFSDPRIQLIAQSNQGAPAAFNRGLAQASGKYLALLNSDDCYHPQRLEKLIQVLEADPGIGLAASHIEVIDATGKTLGIKHGYHDLEPWVLAKPGKSFRAGEDLHAALLTENYLATTSNYVFARGWYEQIGGFRNLRYVHDWDFALRIARVARLSLFPEPLVRYRVHSQNTIRENRTAMIFELCWILAVHLPQHIATAWFAEHQISERVDQLLHSIYTYDCDRVLIMMLSQRISEDLPKALQLLEDNDPSRVNYLEFIRQQIEARGSTKQVERRSKRKSAKTEPFTSNLVRRLTRSIKRQW
jgi:glycosyltransferase involved in cell wall biosynthesis